MNNTVVVQGGLGNQMFQYAFAKSLGDNTLLDISWFKKINVVTPRKLGLLDMRCTLRYESAFRRYTVSRLCKVFSVFGVKSFYPNISENDFDINNFANRCGRYIGYFQDEKLFKYCRNSLLNDFRLKEKICADEYIYYKAVTENTESVSIHVRRGDYLNPVFGWYNLPFEYYRDAIEFLKRILNRPLEIFWFSDDPDYVKKMMIPYLGGVFVHTIQGYGAVADLMLMKSCKHNIIANSSFSWWGAWLNENPSKIVIAPSKWNVDDRFGARIPAEWRVIENNNIAL